MAPAVWADEVGDSFGSGAAIDIVGFETVLDGAGDLVVFADLRGGSSAVDGILELDLDGALETGSPSRVLAVCPDLEAEIGTDLTVDLFALQDGEAPALDAALTAAGIARVDAAGDRLVVTLDRDSFPQPVNPTLLSVHLVIGTENEPTDCAFTAGLGAAPSVLEVPSLATSGRMVLVVLLLWVAVRRLSPQG